MSTKNTSVTLNEELDGFVREQVESGSYRSVSEVVRVAVERLREDARKEIALLSLLDHGLASGRAKPGVFDRVRKRAAR